MYPHMWLTLRTNRKVGVMLTNNPDGIAASNPEQELRWDDPRVSLGPLGKPNCQNPAP